MVSFYCLSHTLSVAVQALLKLVLCPLLVLAELLGHFTLAWYTLAWLRYHVGNPSS